MDSIAVVTVLAVFQAFSFAYLVGKQRVKHGVKAAAITGEAEFERAFRIHQNTVEQMVIFLPALWVFGYTSAGVNFLAIRWLRPYPIAIP